MKTFTYNIRTRKRNTVATVTLIQDGSKCARGIAICCPTDEFNKETAVNISIGRAFKALDEKKSNSKMRDTNARTQPENLVMFLGTLIDHEIVDVISCPYDAYNFYKGVYNPKLTIHEQQALKNTKDISCLTKM